MVKLRSRNQYEDERNARIAENQAKLASLGLERSLEILKETCSPAKTPRKWTKRAYDLTSVRRSSRLKRHAVLENGSTAILYDSNIFRRSSRLKRQLVLENGSTTRKPGTKKFPLLNSMEKKGPPKTVGSGEIRPANAPILYIRKDDLQIPDHVLVQRCNSKGRGSVYNSILGICCHFCRQKKLCGEADCQRCGKWDIEQPCLGKTDCSVCHSSQGVFCRACLKVRYGEDIDEVRKKKSWMCPHCVEAEGSKPYWICNSSICLKKHKLAPTGIAIFKAREMGYESVAHFLMDELKRKNFRPALTAYGKTR